MTRYVLMFQLSNLITQDGGFARLIYILARNVNPSLLGT